MPTEAEDVRAALLWAPEHQIDLAVKGGGHSVAGTSSSDGGLVIDLSLMNSVSVDPAAKTVTVGGGATWKEVDEAAAAHGLAAVGGTVNHTGVGGLTLGGGMAGSAASTASPSTTCSRQRSSWPPDRW